ncbi:arginine N-succinyltransferase [Marinobacterium arenosum]|uniref:arginine N-succinyltransferase n=1 Tax=Marinobacterium arenosum TaxID=2862496 RepID=UPI001C968E20|nr:arginine N-succinyltransferase [Marinobacterium arenosum]MBY4675379.1 arginine N-succinyltransferase [Marinobacterium arenosum]
MMVVRPIQEHDGPALRELARKTGPGFTSLQDNDRQVQQKLESALAAFNPDEVPEEALYLFVMEDTDSGEVVGICGVEAAVGLSDPWYNYRVGTLVHASRELKVYNQINTLTITNDHTGYSELCTLFLSPDARHSKNGSLLSKSRFMFMAEFPQRFNEHLIAEMRGYSDENGVSPFWEGLGRHFFSIDFTQADQLSSMDKVFIAELMPKNTIYTNLLPKDAQEAIGKTHEATTPARRLLENEGMRYTGYIDIFDGGPTLEARLNDIRAIQDSRYVKIHIDSTLEPEGELYLVSTTGFTDFRCCMTPLTAVGNHVVTLPAKVAEALNITEGSTVRVVPLSSGRRF